LFKDKTGEIKVEVDDKKLRGMTVTPETLIRIKGNTPLCRFFSPGNPQE
jgi:uncharacterized protein YdeI (BOF family)